MAEWMKSVKRMRGGLCTPHSEIRTQTRLILQSKGFAGGVPLNTERATVKPWVGI
jgi:hypothetical protein